MIIDKEILSEKNYTGSRLIEITDPKVFQLQAELTKLQLKANPFLEEAQKIEPEINVYFEKIGKLEQEKNKLREEVAPIRAPYDEIWKKVEAINSEAELVKAKIQPLVNKIIEGKLGEFEKAVKIVPEGDKLYVEVVDEIEEKVKAIRQAKIKK